jgi:O-antigen/teichoic acid export membrane protein
VKGGRIVLAGWGALIVAFAAVQLVFTPRGSEIALLAGSGAVVVLGGVAALVSERRRRPRRPAAEPMRWTSASTVALAVGICLFVLGWDVGAWCLAIGAGLAALGLFGLVREIRAERR